MSRVCRTLGAVFSTAADTGVLVGAAGLVGGVFLAVAAMRQRRREAVPWIAFAAFAALGAVMIGLARESNWEDGGVAARYVPLSAIFWTALVGLSMVIFWDRIVAVIGVCAVTLASFVSGQPAVSVMALSALQQDELAIAVRMGLGEGYGYFDPSAVPLMKTVDHYPFNGDFDADCGLLGEQIAPGSVVFGSPDVHGKIEGLQPPINPDSVRVKGWASSSERPIRCIVIADESGRVVGAASYGFSRPDVDLGAIGASTADLGFIGVAHAGEPVYNAYALVSGSDRAYRLDGSLVAEPA